MLSQLVFAFTGRKMLFQWKTSGDTLKFKNLPRRLFRPIAIHTYQKYLNPSGDPVPSKKKQKPEWLCRRYSALLGHKQGGWTTAIRISSISSQEEGSNIIQQQQHISSQLTNNRRHFSELTSSEREEKLRY